MTKLKSTEYEALQSLMKSSKGLDAFSLFRRLKISFSAFSKVTRILCEKELIEEKSDDFFVITPEGIRQVTQKTSNIKQRTWREVPERFLITKIKPSTLYIPSIRLLDKTTFNNH